MNEKTEEILSKTIITGADGMVGSYVDFGIKLNRRALDVTDLNEVLTVCRKYKPKTIIHLAAETDFDRCGRDPQYAYLINSVGTYNMAVAAKEISAKLVYISTSAVFNGSKANPYIETDIPDPQGYYGRSKFLGEMIVKEMLNDYIIARICWVFGGGPAKDQKFIAKVIKQTNQPEIKIVAGKYGSPTYGKDFIAALKKMILNDESGIFHMSNKGAPSRYEVASEIVKITRSKATATEVDESYFSKTYPNERLDNESMISKIDVMRSWQEALKEYIEEEWSDYIKIG